MATDREDATLVQATETSSRRMLTYSRAEDAQLWRLLVLGAALAIVWIVFQLATAGTFLTAGNLSTLAVQGSVTAIVAVGMTWLLVARQLDLSSGALIALVGVIAAKYQVQQHWGAVLTVVIVLVLGGLVGALQGGLVSTVGIPAFIATLGAFSYLRGAAYLVSGASTVAGMSQGFSDIADTSVPAAIGVALVVVAGALLLARVIRTWLTPSPAHQRPRIPDLVCTAAAIGTLVLAGWVVSSQGLPTPVLVLAVIVTMAAYVSKHTAFGRHIYAIGGSPEAARRAGINVGRVIFTLFVVSGVLGAIGGIIQASRLDAGPPDTAQFLALDAISATVIGGTSLFGGRGTLVGAMLGTLFVTSIENGLQVMGVNTFWALVATGTLLVLAIGLDASLRREDRG